MTSSAKYARLPLVADRICYGSTSPARVLTQVINPSAYLSLRGLLRTFRPNVVHIRVMFWQLSPIILSLLRTTPTVFNPADYKFACPTGQRILPGGQLCSSAAGIACLKNACFKLLSQWGLEIMQIQVWKKYQRYIDRVVAQSEGSRRLLQQLGLEVDQVIHNGIAPEYGEVKLSATPTLVFAGRLSAEKGIPVLIKAFNAVIQKIPKARLIIAGLGPEKKKIQKLIAQYHMEKSVAFKGHLDKATLAREMARAWALAVPSICHEPFPNVATEAMIQGTAVIGSAVGGMSDIVIEGKTGLLVPSSNENALAQAIISLLSDRKKAMIMGLAARRRAQEHFNISSTIDQFEQLYLEMAQ